MQHRTILLAALACLLGLSVAASPANAITYSGAGGAIPDDPDGSPFPLQGILDSDIVIADVFDITNVTVCLDDLTHTWVGDQIATLTHVDTGTAVDLFNQIGDPGGGPEFGDSSNFGGDYNFDDSFTGDLWSQAASGDTSFVIPSGDYFASTTDNVVSLLSAFNGESSLGTWRLTLSDNVGGDTGTLGGWSLKLNESTASPVPEPVTASLSLLGLAGLGLATRRRRNA